MANTIKIKRGVEANLPNLNEGELALTTDTKKLFIGTNNGNKQISVDVDNITIEENNDNELQVIGQIEKNKQVAVFDWIGTQQEYLDQYSKGLITNDMICYITDESDTLMPFDATPVGSVISFPSTFIPEGYYLCDGSAKSKTEDKQLYDVIGGLFGETDTTFNLPDYRGLTLVGKDSSTEFGILGKTYGEKKHTLTEEEMPNMVTIRKNRTSGTGNTNWSQASGWANYQNNSTRDPVNQGHNNIQPSAVTNYIIKAKRTDIQNSSSVIDSLNSDSVDSSLSANQGRVLNNKIDNLMEEVQALRDIIRKMNGVGRPI